MKKWIAIVASAALCVIVGAMIQVDITTIRQVIYIKGGEPVLTDSVSQSDQFVFYEADGKTGMFLKADVDRVGSVQVERETPLLQIIDRWKQKTLVHLGVDRKVIQALDIRLLIFLVGLGAAAALARLMVSLSTVLKADGTQPLVADSSLKTIERSSSDDEQGQGTSDLRDIALFFLDLYKMQSGLGQDVPARFSMIDSTASQKMKVFELSVKGRNDWLIRRMSVGPLGEDTGSKSKCYYVIYDIHMVVKIPPLPVTDIGKYVNDIRKEVHIAAQLSPVACIVPMVSVVLNLFKKLPYESSLTREQLEKQYIRLVEEKPEVQEYLKIGNRFAFFMKLSNNFFLGRVIDELHASKNKTGDEIREAPEMVWNQEDFTARYGLSCLPVFEGLQTLYRLCETAAKRILDESGRAEGVHPFQIKNWFLTCIAGEKLNRREQGLGAPLMAQIEEGFSTIFKANQKNVDDFIRLLRTRLETEAFLKSRQQIENIASQILQLLCRLKEKNIVLRDLKPDNLFLDADPGSYPVCLKKADSFSIGVIDVETAVSLVPTSDGTLAQPLLGGTPLYATPLHVFKNRTIEAFFGKLADALYFQDWFAAMAIIFKTITGKNLFPRAARSFPEILKVLKSGRDRSDPDEATVKAMSGTFWSAATTDVKVGLSRHAEVLNQLTLSVPEAMAPSILAELERQSAQLELSLGRQVASSSLLKGDKNRAFLMTATGEDLARQVNRWSNPAGLPEAHRRAAPRMVTFLNDLSRLKQGQMEKRTAAAAFADPPHEITAYLLLAAMFQIAFRALYTSRWKTLPDALSASHQQKTATESGSIGGAEP